eukprot:5486120-Prymnesium_polylepis.1
MTPHAESRRGARARASSGAIAWQIRSDGGTSAATTLRRRETSECVFSSSCVRRDNTTTIYRLQKPPRPTGRSLGFVRDTLVHRGRLSLGIPRPVRLGGRIASVHGGVVFEVAVCNVRALALSVAHS